jgi:hypothetical protein
MSPEAEEERKYQHNTAHSGKQGQNQEDELPVKPGTESHRKMTKREFIEEARKQGASQGVIDALEKMPD